MRRLFVIAGGTYVGVCVILGFLQSRLMYFPSRGYPQTPRDVGLAFDDVTLETSDGVAIAAWYVPAASPNGSIIFCHGNAGNMADRLGDCAVLSGLGYNVLMFDYRGYGRSEGKPDEHGTYHDAAAAWAYLAGRRREPAARIIIFGRSLGGAVAIELATRHPPAALVVESTFTSMEDIARLHYPFLPVRLLLTYRYDSIAKVGRIPCPKLFIHATDDELIPLANGRRLFDAAAAPKAFVETPGGHNTGGYASAAAYTDRLAAFLDAALAR
ncbi:MAG: alpha/beta hydrolase [Phycisphaerae bacterium]